MLFSVVYCVLYLGTIVIIVQSSSILTNFQHEFLRPDWQCLKECQTVTGQAIYLMKNHFINRKRYNESDWALFKDRIETDNSPQQGLTSFMENFHDKYTTYMSKASMDNKWNSGRGFSMGHGIQLERRRRFDKIFAAFRAGLSVLKSKPSRSSAFLQLRKSIEPCSFQRLVDLLLPTTIVAGMARFGGRWALPVIGGGLIGIGIPSLIDTFYPMEVKSVVEFASHGLKAGDEIVSVDNKPVHFMSPARIMKYMTNRNVTLDVWRSSESNGSAIAPCSALARLCNWRRHLLRLKVCEEYLPIPSTSCYLFENPCRGNSLLARNYRSINSKAVDTGDYRSIVNSGDIGESGIRSSRGARIGCITIKDFTENTYLEVSKQLTELKKKAVAESERPMQGLILDLRRNSGGVVQSALDIAAMFVTRGATVLQMNLAGTKQVVQTHNSQPDLATPLLLLCDSVTASASEMLIHAFVDNNRCHTMGCKTFGKDVAQSLVPLSDGSGLVFTVAEYFSPLGRSVSEGHTPMTLVDSDDVRYIDPRRIGYDETIKSWKRM